MSGDLIYRCRRCGKLDRNTRVSDAWKTVSMAAHPEVFVQGFSKEPPTSLTSLHRCEHGEIGVCDLIGANEVGVGEEKPSGLMARADVEPSGTEHKGYDDVRLKEST